MKIWFDGGCRPNPGVIATAVAAGGRVWLRADCATGDNADAEWLALFDAVAVAQALGVADPVLIGDSVMLVYQVTGRARRLAPRFQAYVARFEAQAARFARVRLRHVGRAQNLAGIALDRRWR